MVAFLVAVIPALYILACRRVPLRRKMLYLPGLVLIDLPSIGVLSVFVSDSGNALVSPLLWFFLLLPGFALAALLMNEQANRERT